jgi:hypothetical protein
MNLKFCLTVTFTLFYLAISFAQIKSPDTFLKSKFNHEYTLHHDIVSYVQHVADNSKRVKLVEYGRTNEGRPLLLCIISAPDNINNLEDIRLTNLSSIGLTNDKPKSINEKALVWMSFGVHGNEASTTESSMTIIYNLADESNTTTSKYLENTVVIIDPSANPDGNARYTNWMRGYAGKNIHPGIYDREHMEPWPGGRPNHYLFDLNRDWAWLTQLETQKRIAVYNQWMPHIHADFHEMGINNHYYFAPAAKPLHQNITDFQRTFQTEIGQNHVKYFDKEGWLYFTREVFDLFYPSYGDTYPMYNGAIGMTYEKAGNSSSGRAIDMNNGDVLTLGDRIKHNVTVGLSTVEIASKNSARLISEFNKFFKEATEKPKGKFKTYVIKNSPKAHNLINLLDKHGIKYGIASAKTVSRGFNYLQDKDDNITIEKNDFVISAKQPKSTILQILMDPEPMLEDSVTYDISAWALPYAYGVETYGINQDIPTHQNMEALTKDSQCAGKYAVALPWNSLESAKILAKVFKEGLVVRMANKDVTIAEKEIKRGTIIITRGDNPKVEDFCKVIEKIYWNWDYLPTGFSNTGNDIGGRSFTLLKKPKVLSVMGASTATNDVGQIWHFFDEVLNYPISIVYMDAFSRVNFDEYNTIILPDGRYRLDQSTLEKLSAWVSKGGKIISIEGANNLFLNKEGYALKKFATEDEKKAEDKAAEDKKLKARFELYDSFERSSISNYLAGSIIKNKLDPTHPLTFGLGEYYYSLKTDPSSYKLLKDAFNPIYIPKSFTHYGFIGSQLKPKLEETVSFAVEDKGAGSIIYMVDNPLFRGFWVNGQLLFSNALFF